MLLGPRSKYSSGRERLLMDRPVMMTAVKTALKERYGAPRGPGLEVEKGFLEDAAFELKL